MLDWLKGILGDGHTQDIETKVEAEIGKHFVSRADFNELNTTNKQLKATVEERDRQLNTLKSSTGDVDAMKQTIAQLQADNKTKEDQHAAEMQQLRMDTAVERALAEAKVRNPLTVKPLLDLTEAKLSEDGRTIKGLDAQLKKLAESEDTGYLFLKEDKSPGIKGFTPAEKRDGAPGTGAKPTSLEDAVRMQFEAAKQ